MYADKGECGLAPGTAGNIFGGTRTKIGEFPYVALIGQKRGRNVSIQQQVVNYCERFEWLVMLPSYCA